MLRILRILALAMTFIIAVPATGLGQMLFYCTMTGKVSPHCCCTPEQRMRLSKMLAQQMGTMGAEQQEASQHLKRGGAHLSRRHSCCEVLKNNTPVTHHFSEAFQISSPQPTPVLAKIFLSFPEVTYTILSREVVPVGVRGPPPGSYPPIYKRNCSYLN